MIPFDSKLWWSHFIYSSLIEVIVRKCKRQQKWSRSECVKLHAYIHLVVMWLEQRPIYAIKQKTVCVFGTSASAIVSGSVHIHVRFISITSYTLQCTRNNCGTHTHTHTQLVCLLLTNAKSSLALNQCANKIIIYARIERLNHHMNVPHASWRSSSSNSRSSSNEMNREKNTHTTTPKLNTQRWTLHKVGNWMWISI